MIKLGLFFGIVQCAFAFHYYEPAPLNHDGTVADTHEVALAKAKHLGELAKAGGNTVYAPHYGDELYEDKWEKNDYTPQIENHVQLYHYFPQHYQYAPLKHDGVVDDTPEVKHAKAVHFAAHAAAKSLYPIQTYLADTPEVQHAKALHFAAHQKALHRGKRSYEIYEPEHHHFDYKYHGPPAPLKHDGTVDDTPEVKLAKAEHFAAHAAAKYGSYQTPAQYAEPVHKLYNYKSYEPEYHSFEPIYQHYF